jgi:hypothetical protein
MTTPGAPDPYGYFGANAPSPVEPNGAAPGLGYQPNPQFGSYLSPDEQAMLASGQQTAQRNMGVSPTFYPVGSRIGFVGNIRAGFRLLPTCWTVLTSDLTMLLVPIAVLFVGVIVSAGYVFALGGIHHVVGGGRAETALHTLPLTVLWCVLAVVGRAVVVADAMQRLEGQRPLLREAWRQTVSQLPALIGFGVAFAIERTITGSLRNSAAGRLAANVTDRAWDFATFLAIPAILFEKIGPFAAVRRSGKLVASRWGTQLTATSVLSLAIAVCTIPIVAICLFATAISPALGFFLLIVFILAAIAISSALTGILSAAMYRFATTGFLAPGFAEADMWAGFSHR